MKGGSDVVSVALGFIVFILVLVELHGFSVASAVFAIPAVIFAGLLVFLSHLLGLLTGFFIGGMYAGLFGLLLLGLALIWCRRSLVGFTAQNYMLFAVFLILILLIV